MGLGQALWPHQSSPEPPCHSSQFVASSLMSPSPPRHAGLGFSPLYPLCRDCSSSLSFALDEGGAFRAIPPCPGPSAKPSSRARMPGSVFPAGKAEMSTDPQDRAVLRGRDTAGTRQTAGKGLEQLPLIPARCQSREGHRERAESAEKRGAAAAGMAQPCIHIPSSQPFLQPLGSSRPLIVPVHPLWVPAPSPASPFSFSSLRSGVHVFWDRSFVPKMEFSLRELCLESIAGQGAT